MDLMKLKTGINKILNDYIADTNEILHRPNLRREMLPQLYRIRLDGYYTLKKCENTIIIHLLRRDHIMDLEKELDEITRDFKVEVQENALNLKTELNKYNPNNYEMNQIIVEAMNENNRQTYYALERFKEALTHKEGK